MFRFDETDPRYLIAYEEQHEHSIAPYQELLRRWVARFERGDVFGVVLVNADHIHDEDDDHDDETRDVAFEEAFTKFLNDSRRDYKAAIERCTVGFVRIFAPSWMAEQCAANPDFIEEMRAYQERTTRYLWGVAGNVFLTVDEARAWIDGQIAAFVPPNDTPDTLPPTLQPAKKRVGLFYGSTTGVTESIAYDIAQAWEAHGMDALSPVNIGTVKDLSHLLTYDCLILGIPTWNVGQLQDDWEIAMPQLDTLDFSGKRIALFGIGDQYGYPDNYLDAMGTLGKKLHERGALLVGQWNADGYVFSDSTALHDGKFIGLALDEVHQAEHSAPRIQQWVVQLMGEFALQPQSGD